MNGAMRPTEGLPSQTERAAGVRMANRRPLAAAVQSFQGNEKARAAGRQLLRSRTERSTQTRQRQTEVMDKARQQALLEIMYAESVLGLPREAIQQAVQQGLPWDMQSMAAPQDNMAIMQPPGVPLQGSMGM